MQFLVWVSFAVGWLRGGHTERLAVAVLFWDFALGRSISGMPGAHNIVGVSEVALALIFFWIALRSRRWWTLVASAALGLCAMVFVLEWTTPNLHRDAAISARLGLWLLVHLSLLAGVMERWLAGEPAVSAGETWRRRRPFPRLTVCPGNLREGGPSSRPS